MAQEYLISRVMGSRFEIDFSLMDYINNYFISNDPNHVVEFYSFFPNAQSLLKWMSERPRGVYRLYIIEGDSEIVVVIPTKDYNSKFAVECRNSIYKGLTIIFVEGGGNYFNVAEAVNFGMKKALEFKPVWVVYSGDDVYKIDDIKVLKNELKILDNSKYAAVFTDPPSYYHSEIGFIAKSNYAYSIGAHLFRGWYLERYLLMQKYMSSFFLHKIVTSSGVNRQSIKHKIINYLLRSFAVKAIDLTFLTDFEVLSAEFVKSLKGEVFDPIYINAYEDIDLALRLRLSENMAKINFRIGDFVGETLGLGISRLLRNIASQVYFTEKYRDTIEEFRRACRN